MAYDLYLLLVCLASIKNVQPAFSLHNYQEFFSRDEIWKCFVFESATKYGRWKFAIDKKSHWLQVSASKQIDRRSTSTCQMDFLGKTYKKVLKQKKWTSPSNFKNLSLKWQFWIFRPNLPNKDIFGRKQKKWTSLLNSVYSRINLPKFITYQAYLLGHFFGLHDTITVLISLLSKVAEITPFKTIY